MNMCVPGIVVLTPWICKIKHVGGSQEIHARKSFICGFCLPYNFKSYGSIAKIKTRQPAILFFWIVHGSEYKYISHSNYNKHQQ